MKHNSALLTTLLVLMQFCLASAATYHVDAIHGHDANPGTSPAEAWKTIERVNRQAFQPGDSILFKSGGVWQGQLRPQGSGTEGKPIRLDCYGDGPLPVINASGAKSAVLALVDQDGWEIRHLDLRGGGESAGPGERGGIWVEGRKADRVLKHIHITDCRVSDFRGDLGYRSCGIWVAVPAWNDNKSAPAKLCVDDVLIANNDIRNGSRAGIIVLSAGTSPAWRPQGAPNTEPMVKLFKHLGARKFEITYEWRVQDTFDGDYLCFVHFYGDQRTEPFVLQNDHALNSPTSKWKPGMTVSDGPYQLELPASAAASELFVLAGLYGGAAHGGDRIRLKGVPGHSPTSIALGRLAIQREGDRITAMNFIPQPRGADVSAPKPELAASRVEWMGRPPARNIIVRSNTLEDLAGDAIMVIGADKPLIEGNVARRTCLRTGAPELRPHKGYNPHSAAIWLQNCTGGVMQRNEVIHTGRQSDNNDGMSFDFDYNCFDCLVQYNVSRENEGGLLLIMPTARNNIVRYNLSLNDRTHVLFMQGSYAENNLIHNNVFAVDTPVYFTPGGRLWNNIFYATGNGAFFWATDPQPDQFRGNCFFGRWESMHPWRNERPKDTEMIEADPQFVAPGAGGDGLDAWRGYQLKPASPCLNAGVAIPNHGDRDFWGDPLTDGKPDIGAHESQPPTRATP